jgi:hypothetical protein
MLHSGFEWHFAVGLGFATVAAAARMPSPSVAEDQTAAATEQIPAMGVMVAPSPATASGAVDAAPTAIEVWLGLNASQTHPLHPSLSACLCVIGRVPAWIDGIG